MAMSTIPYSGVGMVFKLASDTITNVRSVTVEVEDGYIRVPADNTSSGWTSYARGEKAWRMSVDCNDIPAEFGSVATLATGTATTTASFMPEGTASALELFSGPAWVGFPTKTVSADGIVGYRFVVYGAGALAIGTSTG